MSFQTERRLFLAGDVGGTNTSLAVVEHKEGKFSILHSKRYSTQAEKSLIEPIERFMKEASDLGIPSDLHSCCVSAAGPVIDDSIQLTNASWAIRAADISSLLGVPAHLINDFTAISYAVVLIDPEDPTQITMIPHTDGRKPRTEGGMSLVIGAGTGLGMGFVEKRSNGTYQAFPSEGGHSEVSCADDLSYSLLRWMREKIGFEPGIELFVSGQGILNCFNFLCSDRFDPAQAAVYGMDPRVFGRAPGPVAAQILAMPEQDRPAAVAASRTRDPRCSLAMELFVSFYAQKVSALSAVFLPSGGIYLAGGISSKNESLLLENHRFMRVFERNYAPHIREYLATIPVLIVKDYSVSLIGAANAALQLCLVP